jgi:AcrR family transcriptional regulator
MAAPSDARQRLQIDERRAQLLELGIRLFSERAYDDVSIDDIADEAGISKGLLYHYFGSKRDFYVATVREAAGQLLARTETDPALPPNERAAAGLDGYLSFVEEHAQPYAALMRSGIGADPEVASVVEETRDGFVTRILHDLGADGRDVFRFLLRSWIGLVEAASLDWLERKTVSRDVVLEAMLESLYAMLLIAMRLDPGADVELGPPPVRDPAAPPRPRASRTATRRRR